MKKRIFLTAMLLIGSSLLTGCSLFEEFEEFFPGETKTCGHVMVGQTFKDGKVINHFQGICENKAKRGCGGRCEAHCLNGL